MRISLFISFTGRVFLYILGMTTSLCFYTISVQKKKNNNSKTKNKKLFERVKRGGEQTENPDISK